MKTILSNLLAALTVPVGFIPAWVYLRFKLPVYERHGILYGICMTLTAFWMGIVVWAVLLLSVAGYGIYRAISG
jgi:hypothetical protein